MTIWPDLPQPHCMLRINSKPECDSSQLHDRRISLSPATTQDGLTACTERVNPPRTCVNFICIAASKWLVFGRFGGSKRLDHQKAFPLTGKEIFMAAPLNGTSGSSTYPLFLFLVYALIVLALWRVDTGLVERQSARSGGDIAVTSSAPPQDDSRSHLRAASLEDLAFGSWGAIPIEAENEEVRRKATVALMVYATGNGIRR
jgi:hypothetical protein